MLVIDGVNGFLRILGLGIIGEGKFGNFIDWLKFGVNGFLMILGWGIIDWLMVVGCFLVVKGFNVWEGFLVVNVVEGFFMVFERREFICDVLSDVYDVLMYNKR